MRLAVWAASIAFLPLPAAAATLLSIGDGDTVTVLDRGEPRRVRLACIDAPEMAQYPFGGASRLALQGLLPLGAEVTLRVKAVDRYGRTVAELVRGRRNLNQALVDAGQAFVYWNYIEGCDRQTYARLENGARLRRLGIWSEPGGLQRPWSFRQGRQGGGWPRPTATVAPRRDRPSGGPTLRCRDLTWSQAQVLLRQGHGELDRDGDGEACESLRRAKPAP